MSFAYVLQRFVSPKETKDATLSPKKETECDKQGKMSGEEARTFYESVLSLADSSTISSKCVKPSRHQQARKRQENSEIESSSRAYKTSSVHVVNRHEGDDEFECDDEDIDDGGNKDGTDNRKASVNSSNQRVVHQFLRYAQEGKLRPIQELLSGHKVDINVCDQFCWTALMCASHSGQLHIVKFLLEKGAIWKACKDLNGRTALDLARLSKNFDVVDYLLTYNDIARTRQKNTFKNEIWVKSWCSICEEEFSDSRKVHQGSTVHLFNTQRKPQRTFYYIPEKNVGYQIMLKSGWNEDQGLGPEGIGRKFPIKTVLKRDRLGLGSKGSQEAKVTHFGPNDSHAVKRRKVKNEKQSSCKPRKTSRRERLTKEEKERSWERNMRIYMNSD